jgi:hypothetical protein
MPAKRHVVKLCEIDDFCQWRTPCICTQAGKGVAPGVAPVASLAVVVVGAPPPLSVVADDADVDAITKVLPMPPGPGRHAALQHLFQRALGQFTALTGGRQWIALSAAVQAQPAVFGANRVAAAQFYLWMTYDAVLVDS